MVKINYQSECKWSIVQAAETFFAFISFDKSVSLLESCYVDFTNNKKMGEEEVNILVQN